MTFFQAQLDRILATLKVTKTHASGPKKPNLAEQESDAK